MLLTEQDTLRAISVAKANPDRPEVIAKAKAVAAAYKRQQEAAGQPLFPEAARAKEQAAATVRGFYTDRERHGLPEATFQSLNENFREAPEEKYRLFNRKFFEQAGIPRDRSDALADELISEYSRKTWGEEVRDHRVFADRLGKDFEFEDAVSAKALESAMSNVRNIDALSAFGQENAENPVYKGRERQWQDQFLEGVARTRSKLAPYQPTVRAVAAILQAKTGTGSEGTETESYRELAERIMEVPKEDRKFVISAIIAAGANDEAGRKGVAKKLAESFGRGLLDYSENIPANVDRFTALAARSSIEKGFRINPEDMSDPEKILSAAMTATQMEASVSELDPLLRREIESEAIQQIPDGMKARALDLADKLVEAIDLRAELRSVAENEIDPISSDWIAMRGLYSATRSMPYTLASIAPGGFFLNSLAMSETSYQRLRAENPDMTAGQAQALSAISGPIQAWLERISGKILTGRLPAFNRFANQVTVTKGAAARRFGARLGAVAGIEQAQENAQDLTPFAIQGAVSALNEDVPGVPWDAISSQFSAENQGELFFAILPLALIGAGVGTVRDYRGAREMLGSYDELRAIGLPEAAASEVRAKAVANDIDGAQSLLRKEFATIGADRKALNEARAEAFPKLLAERERVRELVNKAGDLDMLPAIRNEGGGMFSLQYQDGSGMSFKTYEEADARRWQVASDENLSLHEDTIATIRQLDRAIEEGRETKYLFSLDDPTLADLQAKGEVSEEQAAQRAQIAEETTAGLRREYDEAKTAAGLAAASEEDRAASARILGQSVNEFRDDVVRTTVRLFQGATPLTLIEEKTEGDAKFMIQHLGLRKWMLSSLRDWEKSSGDKLFREVGEGEENDQDIVEAWSALTQAYFVGRSKKGDQGPVFQGSRKNIAKLLSSPLGSAMTGYARLFRAVWRRAAMIEKARRDGTFDGDLEEFLAKSTGISEQRLFERSVAKEGAQVAEELRALVLSPAIRAALNPFAKEGGGATFSVLSDSQPGEFETFRSGPQSGATFSIVPGGVSPENPVLKEINGKTSAEIFASAKKRHGVTRSIYEAGYVLPDGTMLDFSGRADAAGFKQLPNLTFVAESGRDYMRDQRSIDHREIEWDGMPPAQEQWSSMVDFLRLGAIRVDASSGMISMHSRAKVTSAQSSILKAIVTSAEGAYLDLEDDAGNRASMSLDGAKFGKVQGLLTRWANGETPEYDGPTFSLLPDASNLDAEFGRMFSPFHRSPELRMRLGQEMRKRVAEQSRKLEPILRANRTKKSIDAERKQRAYDAFADKLGTLSGGNIQALEGLGGIDESRTPILADILRPKIYTRKDGAKVTMWRGILMSKRAAERAGMDTSGGEWDDIPALPSYVWGGTETPDSLSKSFGFDTAREFLEAIAAEIQSVQTIRAEGERVQREVSQMKRDARAEAKAWAEKALRDRETVGSDRATLLGFLRALDAITRALPAEVRGKIGGAVALAQLTTPGAMLGEIERRVQKIDVELERWMKREATKQAKDFFEKVGKSKQSEAGKTAKGKKNLPEIYAVMTMAEKAFRSMSAEEGRAEGEKIVGMIARGEVAPDDIAAAEMAAELIPLFSGWNGRTEEQEIDGETKVVRVSHGSGSAQRFAAVEAAKQFWTEGVLERKRREAETRERRDSIRADAMNDIASRNKLRTRDEQEIISQTRGSLPKKFILNIMNIDGFFRWHLGENSLVYKWITDSERKAANQYDDAVRRISKSVDDWFTKRAGSRFKGEKLREKMAQSRVKLTPEKGEVRELSQLQLITAKLIWRQDDGKRHMKGRKDDEGNIVSLWSYGEGFMAQVDEAISDDALALMDFLSDAYDAEYPALNRVYRKLFGIDLPKHLLYSPLTVKPSMKGDPGSDPVTGFFSGGLSGVAGALKTRGTSIVEPDFKDALGTYVAHSMQMEHFQAFAELAREARAIFGRVEFQDQIGRASGEEGVNILNGLLEMLDKGGIRSSHLHLEATKTLEKLVGRLSTMILFGKLQTVALNVTQLGAGAVEMGPKLYIRQLGKLVSGQIDWLGALRTDYIQRRIDEMPPVIRQAIESNRILGPSRLSDINNKLGWGISASDGVFTAGTYAMVYDWKRQQGAEFGLADAELETWARNETERIVERLAQPTRKGARSIFENNMGAGERALFNFISEPRKNLSLLAYAYGKDPSKIAGTSMFLIFSALVSAMIRATWADLRYDDEDEDEAIWNPGKLALEIGLDPVYGIPVVGGMIQDAVKAGFGFKTYSGTILESGQSAIPAAKRMASLDYDADEIDRIAADFNAILGAFGYFSRRAAGATAITNVVEDAFKVYDNLTQN